MSRTQTCEWNSHFKSPHLGRRVWICRLPYGKPKWWNVERVHVIHQGWGPTINHVRRHRFLLLPLRSYDSPMRTFGSLMDFYQVSSIVWFVFPVFNFEYIYICLHTVPSVFGRKHAAHCCKIFSPYTKWLPQTNPTLCVQGLARPGQKGQKLLF
jgi:hypothetical protein